MTKKIVVTFDLRGAKSYCGNLDLLHGPVSITRRKRSPPKIVYYGPGLCGKTTNLQFIYESLPSNHKSKMLSLSTKTDRTLFFDFLPLDLGKIRGMRTKLQLYTVPGQVYYNSTRQLVLKGADGVVFVADSQESALDANLESIQNLEDNLKRQGRRFVTCRSPFSTTSAIFRTRCRCRSSIAN